MFEFISEMDVYKFSPWDLPDKSAFRSNDLEWFFFCPIEKKYGTGCRMNRATESGYWKTTGRDRSVMDNGEAVGIIKTLIFHEGRPPGGKRTDWVMHEYRLEDKNVADSGVFQDPYVICKIFKKSGLGPRNGAQYGAPFNEEEWDEDEGDGFKNPFPSAGLPVSASLLSGNHHFDLAPTGISSLTSVDIYIGSSCGLASSTAIPSPVEMRTTATDYSLPDSVYQSAPDDVSSLLQEMFTENASALPTENNNMEKLDEFEYLITCEGAPSLDDIFNELENLDKPVSLISDELDICAGSYLELNDLDSPLYNSHAPPNITTCGPPTQYIFEHDHENFVPLDNEHAPRQHPSDNESLSFSPLPFGSNCDMHNFQQNSCNVLGHGYHDVLFDVGTFCKFENQGNNSTG